jgi:ADP-heptose:LPS heptosyltransferase
MLQPTDEEPIVASSVTQRTNDTEWTDCMGFPQVRPVIRKILCLKVDHIGDILVADFAFRLLRKYFPDSHITLICGEWNVELAEALGLADVVIGVSLFHPQGAEQHNQEFAAAAKSAGISRLMEVVKEMPEFDLAIDMRIDEDTREFLKLFKSKVYVGGGDLQKYPFLDISVPKSATHLNRAPTTFRVVPNDFVAGSGYDIQTFGIGFVATILAFPVQLEITGARSPVELGTSANDERLLGIGIHAISLFCAAPAGSETLVKEFLFHQNSPDWQFLTDGWSRPEAWGTWSTENKAGLNLSTGDTGLVGDYRLVFRFRALVNQQNRVITLKATDMTSGSTVTKDCEFPLKEFQLSLPVTGERGFGIAKTRPVGLRAGRHLIRVDTLNVDKRSTATLKLSILGTRPERTIKSVDIVTANHLSSRESTSFEICHRDSDELIQVQLETGSSGRPFGLYVMAVSSHVLQIAPPKVPPSHMEKLIARLVMASALEFSPIFHELFLVSENRFKLEDETSIASRSQVLADYLARIAKVKRSYRVVGIGIGTTKETKKWPFGYMLEMCELLLGRPDVFLVLVGGPNDVADTLVLEEALHSPSRVLNFCGQTKLADFGVVVSPMDLYIGYDTGTTHFAGKVGIRTIGIFAAVHSPREWGPVGRKASWITHYTDCSPCHLVKLDQCRYGHACMVDLMPSECWKTISEALDSGREVGAQSAGSSDEPDALVDRDTNAFSVFSVSAEGALNGKELFPLTEQAIPRSVTASNA